MSGAKDDWYRDWFGEEYMALYPHRDEAEAEVAVGLVEARAHPGAGARVLDLACGAGRHSRALSSRWWTVGLDLSHTLLESAVATDREGHYVRGDMRALPFADQSFQLVVNLFTSFGYFENDAQHMRVLAEVARVLSRGGHFVLDFLNAPRVRQTLVPVDTRTVDGRQVIQRRDISADGRFIAKTIEVVGTGKQHVERVRLFSPDDLTTMLEEAGFGVTEIAGDYSGAKWSERSDRAIMIAVRE